MKAHVLDVKNLSKEFPLNYGIGDRLAKRARQVVHALNDVSFSIREGETIGLVGESGCGKTTLARCIIRLYKPTTGNILLKGQDITHLSGKELRSIRPDIQMIFQDPYSSLNPRMSVYDIIKEMLQVHRIVPEEKIDGRVFELLEMCGLGKEVARRYPGEFSGGQRQRVGIARALALQPSVIIADEPVSALDVSIQAQILNLLEDLQKELNLTILFISHDLQVVRFMTDRTAVMYLGSIIEIGKTDLLFETPMHPYTEVLTKAAPVLDPDDRVRDYVISGEPPSPINIPSGCPFHPRCNYCQNICRQVKPELTRVRLDRSVACHFPLNQLKTT